MTRTLQYDINDTARACLRLIYNRYVEKSSTENVDIEQISLDDEEIKEIVNNFYLKQRDIREKSKQGITVYLKNCLKLNEDKSGYNLTPLSNLVRLSNRKIENEVLYIALIKYCTIFQDIITILNELIGPNRDMVFNKDFVIDKVIEELDKLESIKKKPLGSNTISNNVRRSIDNMININIILTNDSDGSLEKEQIRIKSYFADYRLILILYLEERDKKKHLRPALSTIVAKYIFLNYFFLTKQTLKKCLKPGVERNLFYYQSQIGDAINENFNKWEISKK